MNKSLTKRTKVSLWMIFIVIPLGIYTGMNLADRRYSIVSILICIAGLVPFYYGVEKKRPHVRELLLLFVLSAIAVASRTAFIFVPFFKPLAAVVIMAGVSFGGEAGFLCGILSVFLSNFIFGQGPWTPYQMFAFGMAGFIAGILHKKGVLGKDRYSMSVFGAVIVLLVVGPLLDLSSILTSASLFSWTTMGQMIRSGVSVNTIHALSTALFLLTFSRPMLEKLDRMKMKYGIQEEL